MMSSGGDSITHHSIDLDYGNSPATSTTPEKQLHSGEQSNDRCSQVATTSVQDDTNSNLNNSSNEATDKQNTNCNDAREDETFAGKEMTNLEVNAKDKRERKDEKFRKNGNIDKLDGVWLTKENKKAQNDKEIKNGIVDCLYYTNACCDCSIM